MRRVRLAEMLRAAGRLTWGSIGEMARELAVSTSTMSRDVAAVLAAGRECRCPLCTSVVPMDALERAA